MSMTQNDNIFFRNNDVNNNKNSNNTNISCQHNSSEFLQNPHANIRST